MAAAVVACSSSISLPSSRSFPIHDSFRSSASGKHRISFSPSSSSASLMDSDKGESRPCFMDFPYVSPQQRDLMLELVSNFEDRLRHFLLPSELPPDIRYVQNSSGTSRAAFHLRPGLQSSPIDLLFGSWIHCELPSGAALNITSLSAYLNSSTDAPNFVFELIQSSPTSAVLILDMYPRRDPVLQPEYVTTFYEGTELDRHRQLLAKLPEVRPYITPSLFLRCMLSPTAIMVCIETEAAERLLEIVDQHVSPIAKEMVRVWIDGCALGGRQVGENEKEVLLKRDRVMKTKSIEMDLESSFPRLFGQEVADRVISYIRELFNL